MAFQINGTTVINDSAGEGYGISRQVFKESSWGSGVSSRGGVTAWTAGDYNLADEGLIPTAAGDDEDFLTWNLIIDIDNAYASSGTFQSDVTIRFDGDAGDDEIVLWPSTHVITQNQKIVLRAQRMSHQYFYQFFIQAWRTESSWSAPSPNWGYEMDNFFNGIMFAAGSAIGGGSYSAREPVISYPLWNGGSSLLIEHNTYWK